MSGWVWAGVALLGGGGAIGRFLVDGVVEARRATGLPVGTFVVNISGAFVLGVLAGLGAGGDDLVLAGAATLGSYTTFSTWMFETERLTEDGGLRGAAANILLSLAVGVAAAAIGHAIGAHA
jgi:CrcB protein